VLIILRNIHLCTYVKYMCLHVNTHVLEHLYGYLYVYIYMNMYYIYIYIYTDKYTYTICIYTYICIYVHAHIQTYPAANVACIPPKNVHV